MKLASQTALAVLESCGINDLSSFELENVLYSRGISMIRTTNIGSAEGRILMQGDQAIVTINASIKYEPKIRFVLAHELGHYELHRNTSSLFVDRNLSTESSLTTSNIQEIEANIFAKEILMPELIISQVFNDPPSIELISKVANYFQTSLSATALRLVELSPYPLAVISTNAGRIQWRNFTNNFFIQVPKNGSEIPYRSSTYKFLKYQKGQNISEISISNNESWSVPEYSNDLSMQLKEQCVRIAHDTILTLLWYDSYI